MKNFLFFVLFTISNGALAQSKPVIECGMSNGVRFDTSNGKVEITSDKATRRFFLTIDIQASKIKLLMPETKTPSGLVLQSYSTDLIIISTTENQITAIDLDETGDMVGLYSLFPKERIIYQTQHRYQSFSGGTPNNTSLWAKCKF